MLDCFHVLKRCHDAIEEVRLHLKRDAQVELRRQEREHRQTQSVVHKAADDIGRSIPESREL